jgi:hypothetical protein
MDPIDQLPPDLSAVLSLLLRQGRSYADIARLLGIPEQSVRDRAYAALDAIAAGPIPAGSVEPEARRTPGPSHTSASPTGLAARSVGSRRAGGLLLGAILVAVIVAVVLIANNGGSSHTSSNAASTTSTSGSSSGAASGPQVDKQLNLASPDPNSNAVGIVEIVSEGSKLAFLLSAEHLPPTTSSSFYAAWLYNSPSDAVALGRAPSVSSNGKLQAVGALPTNATHFHTMLVTRETSTHPKRPGPTVLSGPFSVK